MTIAVCLDEFNQTATLETATHIELYTNRNTVWDLAGSFLFTTKNTTGMSQFRQQIDELIQTLNTTKIIVFKQLVGLSYTLLDNAGFHIWEFDDMPSKFLDFIALKEMELNNECVDISNNNGFESSSVSNKETTFSTNESLASFTELGSGKYFCNLKHLLQYSPHLTTKKVLKPFLEHVTFYELEIIVDHLPPWLAALNSNYEITMTDLKNNTIQLIITPLTCSTTQETV